MFCYVKGCSKLAKAVNPNLELGFCDEQLDEARKPIEEYVDKVNAMKRKLNHTLRNLKTNNLKEKP